MFVENFSFSACARGHRGEQRSSDSGRRSHSEYSERCNVIGARRNSRSFFFPSQEKQKRFSFFQQRPKGDVKATTERTDTDKKHARRLIKKKLKLTAEAKVKSSDDQQDEKGSNSRREKRTFFIKLFFIFLEEKRNLLKKLGKMKNVRIEKVRFQFI